METLNIEIGAQVRCTDRQCGQLGKVALDPYTQWVTQLIVQGNTPSERDFVVPISAVERATDGDIYLAASSHELDRFVEFRQGNYAPPPAHWTLGKYTPEQVVLSTGPAEMVYPRIHPNPVVSVSRYAIQKDASSEPIAFGRGTPVTNPEGHLGRIDHVLVDETTNQICHLVVDRGFYSQSVIVPVSMVEQVDEGGILVQASEKELRELPQCTCRSDTDILAEVKDRLEAAAFDADEIQLEMRDGVLRLSGVVWDVASKRRAEATARSVEGVIEVENALDTNLAIIARVTAALLADPRTEVAIIEVACDRSVVTLGGKVDSPAVREAAEEIASKQPGVIQVVNGLEVGKDEHTDPLMYRLASLYPLGTGLGEYWGVGFL
jgi:osmotically-inducible protein OsmY